MPKNVNDAEFEPKFDGDLLDREGLMDITSTLIAYCAQANGKILNFIPTSETAKSPLGATYNWEARQGYVENFEQNTIKLLQNREPSASPYAWLAFHRSQAMVAATKLSALRPLHRAGSGAPP